MEAIIRYIANNWKSMLLIILIFTLTVEIMHTYEWEKQCNAIEKMVVNIIKLLILMSNIYLIYSLSDNLAMWKESEVIGAIVGGIVGGHATNRHFEILHVIYNGLLNSTWMKIKDMIKKIISITLAISILNRESNDDATREEKDLEEGSAKRDTAKNEPQNVLTVSQ